MPQTILQNPPVNFVLHNASSGDYYIEIPIPNHVKTFMLAMYSHGQPHIQADCRNIVGNIVTGFVKAVPAHKCRTKKRLSASQCTLRVVLTDSLKHVHIEENNLHEIGLLFKQYMYEFHKAFVLGSCKTGMSEMNASNLFLKMFDIDIDDWDNDSAYANWKRFKKNFVFADHL